MSNMTPVEFEDATEDVKTIYREIMDAKKADDVPIGFKMLANDPAALKRAWETNREIMAAGALDVATKQLIYLAVSITNGCQFCVENHRKSAAQAGVTQEMYNEMMAVVGLANQYNRYAIGFQMPFGD